jgi:hypothetical protein
MYGGRRNFDQLDQCTKEARGRRSINDAMVERQIQSHLLSRAQLAALQYNGLFAYRADSKHGGFGKVDDRRECVYAESA